MIIGRRRVRPAVTVYTRQGCGLCRRAEHVVLHVGLRAADITLVDIDHEPTDVRERYTLRVPVVAVDGVEVAEVEVDPGVLRAAIRSAREARIAGS